MGESRRTAAARRAAGCRDTREAAPYDDITPNKPAISKVLIKPPASNEDDEALPRAT